MTYDNINSWYAANGSYEQWYKQTYPILNDFPFPVPLSTILDFYNQNTREHNIDPNPAYQSSYELLFSYFLANYNNPNQFTAHTWLQNLLNAIPKGISKTVTDIKSGIPSLQTDLIIIAIIIVVVLIIITQIK